MAEEKNAGVGEEGSATTESSQAEGESVLDDAVRKVREQREEKIPHTIVEEKPLPNAMRQIVIELPREDWERRVEEIFKELKQNATIEGFRKGKAPLSLLKRRYIKEAQDEVVQKMIPPVMREYAEEKQVTMYGTPTVMSTEAEGNGPVRVTVQVEVKPEIEAQDYTGQEVEAPETKLTEEMINQRIEELRMQNASYEEVERELKPEDAAVFDIKAVDSKGHTVEQKANQFMENPHDELPHELAHEVIGKKAGDTIEAKVPNPRKAGETLRYTVQLKSVKELRLPNLDDEFAKDAGYENLDAMRKTIEEGIQSFLNEMNEDAAFDALVTKLVEKHTFDVPPTLKASIENDIMRSDVNYMYSTGTLPPRSRGLTRKEYREKIEQDAETRVKGFLLVDAIGRKENITADEADINAALEDRGRQEGRKAVAIRAALERRREFDQFVEQVRFNKIRRFLLEKSKVTYVEPKPEEKPEEKSEEGQAGEQ